MAKIVAENGNINMNTIFFSLL